MNGLIVATLLLGELAAAFAISRTRPGRISRCAAWLLAIVATGGAERITAGESAVPRMLAIVLALLWGMKAVVSVEEQIAGKPPLRPLNWWLFAIGWLGMRPTEFLAVPGQSREGWQELVLRGAKRSVLGLILIVLAVMIRDRMASAGVDGAGFVLTTGLLLTGLSLILHFGLLNLLAGWWRFCGANCRALFRAPVLSTSLAEFWAQRWNLAFSEMTSIAIVRPLRARIGTRSATVVAFLFSGLMHELAISAPVHAGYGLPMAYFALHAGAVTIEQGLASAGLAVNRIPAIGRIWTAVWVLVPLPLLFHDAFLRGCVWPLVS